jgi:hypothetical protein
MLQFSVTASLELSLAEFRDEEAWPQLQLIVYKKIIGLWFFLVLNVKSTSILIFKIFFLCQKLTETISIFFSLKNIKKGDHLFILTYF